MTTLYPIGSLPVSYAGGGEYASQQFFDPREAVISQYANSPVLLALIDRLGQAFDRAAQFDQFYRMVWDIRTARGFGLDIWGRIVGVTRALYISTGAFLGFSQSSDAKPFGEGIWYVGSQTTSNYKLTDEAFRRVILAKAALNITDSSISSVNAILRALFPGYGNVWVRDNGDMTMTYVFGAPLSKVDYAIVTQSGVLPKPIGVSFTVEQP